MASELHAACLNYAVPALYFRRPSNYSSDIRLIINAVIYGRFFPLYDRILGTRENGGTIE